MLLNPYKDFKTLCVHSGQAGGGAAVCSVLSVIPQGGGVCDGKRGVLQRGAGTRWRAERGQYLLPTALNPRPDVSEPRAGITHLLKGGVTETRDADCGVYSVCFAVFLGRICHSWLAALMF